MQYTDTHTCTQCAAWFLAAGLIRHQEHTAFSWTPMFRKLVWAAWLCRSLIHLILHFWRRLHKPNMTAYFQYFLKNFINDMIGLSWTVERAILYNLIALLWCNFYYICSKTDGKLSFIRVGKKKRKTLFICSCGFPVRICTAGKYWKLNWGHATWLTYFLDNAFCFIFLFQSI